MGASKQVGKDYACHLLERADGIICPHWHDAVIYHAPATIWDWIVPAIPIVLAVAIMLTGRKLWGYAFS